MGAAASPLLHEWLLDHAERRPEAPAVGTEGARLSYGDLAGRVRALAAHLAAGGVRAGDRVVAALPSTPAAVAASLAVQVLGALPVEVKPEWGADMLGEVLTQTGARQAFVRGRDARAWGRLGAERGLDRLWVVHGGPLPASAAPEPGAPPATLVLDDGRVDPSLGPAPAVAPVRLDPTSAALVLYTSGSTGRPRGVIQTFRNIDANARSIVKYLDLGESDRAMLVLPLSYCYGRSVLQTHLLVGGSVFLDARFAFPRVVLGAMASEGCTGFAGVPLTFEIIRRQVDLSTLSFPRLRYLTQAGGPMAPETIEWARRAFAPAKLFVMYGQTEATSRLSYLPPERAEEKRGSIGIPIPGVELRVVDEEGRELPDGETGHLVARGDNVTPGYLGQPEETAALLRRGWLWTGDLARRDPDGYFFHRGRSKEILKIGGHRVSPTEIEHVLAAHPDVAEAAIVGAPDALMGEVPVAFVVARPDRRPGEDALEAFCRARLPSYCVPVRFTMVGALPRNDAGKLLRTHIAGAQAPTAS
jgi:acyl-CoA synthetase (AMP-forming)/AMP-acid ligase II